MSRWRVLADAALLALLAATLAGIEVSAMVVRIVDGDTLTVRPAPGLPSAAKQGWHDDVFVRLLCIDTLEIHDQGRPLAREGFQARDLLAELCPPGTAIALYDEGESFALDRHGRVLAFVRTRRGWAQEILIRAGLTVYWRRWRLAPPELDARFAAAEAEARRARRGAWATLPELMARKAAERPP
ncbi:MAG: thermonuclease family protein [Planctomycetota bacterium]|nr:thermonuclease family protein [Planctomycetota bacterium]MCX8040122.1 thermonuclease family protein [Planctomycetota bacterium]MDW8373420.1 thermonuclease family protein [Planctomycetota bacterium]